MRKAIVSALTSLLISAGVASGQTASAPSAPSTAPSEVGRLSISAEALLWWFKGSPTPVPLVSNGLLDVAGTKVLLGGKDLDTNPNSGFRVTVGYSLTDRWGAEGSVFYLLDRSTSRTAGSSGQIGSQDLLIPFFDVTLPGEPVARGRLHLITQIRREFEDVFLGLGYRVFDGPDVDTVFNNFTALNTPEAHPSRDPQDTFYLDDDTVLRTHTSTGAGAGLSHSHVTSSVAPGTRSRVVRVSQARGAPISGRPST